MVSGWVLLLLLHWLLVLLWLRLLWLLLVLLLLPLADVLAAARNNYCFCGCCGCCGWLLALACCRWLRQLLAGAVAAFA